MRVLLFGVLAYMIFALAYDYLYVFPTHDAKYKEVMALVEAETKRSAEAADKDGATGPEEVAEVVGFGSGGIQDGGHYMYERFTYRRGLPWMNRFLEVYYKGPQDDLRLVGVAHSDEDILEDTPKPPVVPSELPEGTPDDPPEEEVKGYKKATEEPADDKKTTEEPADDKKTTEEPADDKKTDDAQPDENKTDDKKSNDSEPPADPPATDPDPSTPDASSADVPSADSDAKQDE